MLPEDESLRKRVKDRCERLKSLLRSIVPQSQNIQAFIGWAIEIKATAEWDPQEADRLFHTFIRQLRELPDGSGGAIWNAERKKTFFEGEKV